MLRAQAQSSDGGLFDAWCPDLGKHAGGEMSWRGDCIISWSTVVDEEGGEGEALKMKKGLWLTHSRGDRFSFLSVFFPGL